MRRRALLSQALGGVLAAALAPSLAACGDKPSGGVVRVLAPLPERLEPESLQTDLDALLAAHVYSGLVTLNPEGEPIPDLAQRWSISQDGRTYTFPLRPNVRYHDGERLIAPHVKAAWERALHPQTEAPAAMRVLGKIAGVARYRNGLAPQISGVRAPDDRTLEVDLAEADVSFPAQLAHPLTYVAPPGAGSGRRMPVGAGPFAAVAWVPGASLSLVRNEEFYGFEPLLDGIEIMGGADADSLQQYAQDAVDILYIGANDILLALDRNNPVNKDLQSHDGLDMTYLAMNNRIPPFDDEGVRRAFAMVIDRAAIAEEIFAHTVGKAETLLLPSLAQSGESPAAEYDVSKARQSLAESRYRDIGNLPEVTFTVPGTRGPPPSHILALTTMVQQHLGAQIRIQREPWDTFVDNLDRRQNPYQLFLFTWHADYPDPQAVLDPLFRSNSLTNYSGYADQEVDALLLAARGERDRERRLATMASIEERVAADAPVTPLWHTKSYLLIKPWVRDVRLSAVARPWLNQVYLDD